MGITINGKYKGELSPYELSMSYSTFFRLRLVIAKNLNDNFGKHYERLTDFRATKEEWDAYDNETQRIIEQEHLEDKRWQQKIIDFLFMPDTNGKISYGTCKRLYDLVKNENDSDIYGYAMIGNNTMGEFKRLLHDTYVNGGYLKWE